MFDPRHALAVHIFNRHLNAEPISTIAFEVLTKVHAAEGIAQSALARCLRIPPPTLTHILGRLVRAGLVRQVPSPVDRRRRFVRLTPLGRRGVDAIQDARLSAEAA